MTEMIGSLEIPRSGLSSMLLHTNNSVKRDLTCRRLSLRVHLGCRGGHTKKAWPGARKAAHHHMLANQKGNTSKSE